MNKTIPDSFATVLSSFIKSGSMVKNKFNYKSTVRVLRVVQNSFNHSKHPPPQKKIYIYILKNLLFIPQNRLNYIFDTFIFSSLFRSSGTKNWVEQHADILIIHYVYITVFYLQSFLIS